MKPNPLAALYHFTVPISRTLASKGCRSDGDLNLPRGDLGGAAVLLSTLMTSVTCGPRCPRTTCNSSVSPGCRVLTPMPASAVTWRKASPDPSESWTKPYPLFGLNHLTCPRTAKPDDPSNSGSAAPGGTSELIGAWPEPFSSTITRPL